MSSSLRRRKYDPEFKREAVRLLHESGRSVAAVAGELGIHPSLLHRWEQALAADPVEAFPGLGQLKPAAAEVRQLQRENATLRDERDILKKALAVFSQRPR